MAMFGVPDMTALEELGETSMLKNIETRLIQGSLPYTFISNVLVAVNPLKAVASPSFETFENAAFDPNLPHPNALAELAYQRLATGRSPDQSLVISGESGSGKTETSKIVIEYLTRKAMGAPSDISDLASRVIAISPVLETFGNASTHRNPNSSRFGRFVKLLLTEEQRGRKTVLKLTGGELQTYLLEKSRVVRQGEGERNFHAFHMLIDHRPSPKLQGTSLLLDNKHQHRNMPAVVNLSKAHAAFEGSVPTLSNVEKSMNAIAMSAESMDAVWCVLGSICSLCDVEVLTTEDAVSCEKIAGFDVSEGSALWRSAQLLGVDFEALRSTVAQKKITTGGETVVVPRGPLDAAAAVDAGARWLYGALFAALVDQCNEALKGSGVATTSEGPTKFVGILDIFGFETLESNGLETLLINYANEALQQLFCDAIFKAELELYAAEGIDDAAGIEPPDSKATIEFITGKGPPPGVLRILDAQCATGSNKNKHNDDGTDDRDVIFLQRIKREHKGNAALAKTPPLQSRSMFHVTHYAGEVGYTVVSSAGWVEANLDSVPDGLADAVEASSNAFVASMVVATTKGLARADSLSNMMTPGRRLTSSKTVASRFSSSMTALASTLAATDCGFVRCIKPNAKMVRDNFDGKYVRDQLRALGLVAACEVLRVGLPHRVDYDQLLGSLPATAKEALKGESSELVVAATLLAFDVPTDTYRLGRTRVFFPASALRLVNDVLSFDAEAEPERAAKIAKRLVEAKESAAGCREAAETADSAAKEARESAEKCDIAVSEAAESSGFTQQDDDEAQIAKNAQSSAEEAAQNAQKAEASAQAAAASAARMLSCEPAQEASREAAAASKEATRQAGLAQKASEATASAASSMEAASQMRAAALKAADNAESAADDAEKAAIAASSAARRLRLSDTQAARDSAVVAAKEAATFLAEASSLLSQEGNSNIADSKADLSKAALEATVAAKLARSCYETAKKKAKTAAASVDEAMELERLELLKKQQEAEAAEARRVKKEQLAEAKRLEEAQKKAKEEEEAKLALIEKEKENTAASSPPPEPPATEATSRSKVLPPAFPSNNGAMKKYDDSEEDEEQSDDVPLEHEAVSERLTLFRKRVNDRINNTPEKDEDDDDDASVTDSEESSSSESGSDDEFPRTARRKQKRPSDGSSSTHWSFAHLQRFKRWILLERTTDSNEEFNALTRQSSSKKMVIPPLVSTSLLRDMQYAGIERPPTDPTPTDPRPALQHACVKRKKGTLTMSQQSFELCLGNSNDAILSAKKTSHSIYYHIFDETRGNSSASKRSQVLARICEITPTTPQEQHEASNDVALFGHQRAARGGAPRELGVVLGGPPPRRSEEETGTPTILSRFDARDRSLQLLVQRAPTKRDNKYSLDFRGRGKVASVKNFQLVVASASSKYGDEVVLQFCKVGTNRFNLDYAAPFTPLTAFALAVSTCLA